VTPPYDLDGNPSSLSSAERTAIVSIWRTVAEDYLAWDVDVTTEEPPGTDHQADASLVGIGTRVAVGKNNGWSDNAGGVAFVGGFAQNWSGTVVCVPGERCNRREPRGRPHAQAEAPRQSGQA